MKAVLALLVVLAVVSYSVATKCYVCIGCSTPTGETDCLTDSGCVKVDLDGTVTRSCGVGASAGCSSVKALGIKTTTCNCNGDLCNSAASTTVSMFALLAPLLAAKLFN